MATRGQKFELDLDAPNFQFDVKEQSESETGPSVINELKERDTDGIPSAPTLKSTRTGFPERRPRKTQSAFKKQGLYQESQYKGPSDRAILHHVAKKQGIDLANTKTKADIDAENRDRLNNMTLEEVEEARADLMAQFNPEALRKFLQRANVDEDSTRQQKEWENHESGRFTEAPQEAQQSQSTTNAEDGNTIHELEAEKPSSVPSSLPSTSQSNVHFPAPPRNKADFKPLDPSSDTFLNDLREHYFPELPHDPNALSWLQDPTPAEDRESAYNPERAGFAPSAVRFDFNGNLIPPAESLEIPTSKGLHHHGEAPSSAGYTIPELALLGRSTLDGQRSVSHQVTGRILFRLGRGDFGPKGSDMNEGLWNAIERERILEVIMAEANRDKGPVSAKAFATEALWLWRRGGGGDRGILKEGERRAK